MELSRVLSDALDGLLVEGALVYNVPLLFAVVTGDLLAGTSKRGHRFSVQFVNSTNRVRSQCLACVGLVDNQG